jgi:putative transposase
MSRCLLRERALSAEEGFEVIHAESAAFPIGRLAGLLGVSMSGCYSWTARRDASPGPRAARRAELTALVTRFHGASDGVNGEPPIRADLRAAGETLSRKTVAKITAG